MVTRLKWSPCRTYYMIMLVTINCHLLYIEGYMKVGRTPCTVRDSHEEVGLAGRGRYDIVRRITPC